MANQQCEQKVALVPFRYSARPLLTGETSTTPTWFKFTSMLNLESSFPALKHSRYNLRLIDNNMFVYVFDATNKTITIYKVKNDTSFIELINAGKGGLEGAFNAEGKPKPYSESGAGLPWIFVPEKSEVYLMTTNALLTKKLAQELLKGGALRDKLCVRVHGGTWEKSSPQKGTFHYEKTAEVLDEILLSKSALAFSPFKAAINKDSPAAFLKQMQEHMARHKTNKCYEKQIGVVLLDNIALTRDLQGAYFHKAETLGRYIEPDDQDKEGKLRKRKKVIAEIIEQLYITKYAQDKKIADPTPENIEKTLEADVKRDFISRHHSRHTASGGAPFSKQSEEDKAKTRVKIIAASTELMQRHIKEDERKAFLAAYNAAFDRLYKSEMEAKNDWSVLLATYEESGKVTDLGATFLRYDMANDVASSISALEFSHCTEGMMADARPPEGMKDEAKDLYCHWMDKIGEASPIKKNLLNDKGFAGVFWENKSDAAAGAVGGAVDQLSRYVAVGSILNQSRVYIVSAKAHEGAKNQHTMQPKERIAKMKVLNEKINGNVDDLVKYLTKEGSGISHHVKVEQTITEAEAWVMINAELRIPVYKTGMTGNLAAVRASQRAADEMKKTVKIRVCDGMGKARFIQSALPKLEGASALIVSFFAAYNFVRAIDTFDTSSSDWAKNWGSGANLLYSGLSVGVGLNAVTSAFDTQLNAKLNSTITRSSAYNWLKGAGALKFFGYGAAIVDGVTYSLKAVSAHNEGNAEARNRYAWAAGCMAGGGSLLTYGASLAAAAKAAAIVAAAEGGVAAAGGAAAGGAAVAGGIPIVGWIVLGIIVIGVGIYFIMQADEAGFTDIDYWLNSSTWGKKAKIGDGSRPVDTYSNLGAEEEGLAVALNCPRVLHTEWDHEKVATKTRRPDGTFKEISVPGYRVEALYPHDGSFDEPQIYFKQGNNITGLYCKEDTAKRETYANGGQKRTYHVFGLNNAPKENRYTLRFGYLPHGAKKRVYKSLEIKNDESWVYF